MKRFLICFLIVLLVFFIYSCNRDKKIYYLALGDKDLIGSYSDNVSGFLKDKGLLEKYINDFVSINYFTTDLINDIKSNKTLVINNKDISIQNALIKADLLTLSLSISDIFNKLDLINPDYNSIYDYIDQKALNFNRCLKLLRQYCKEEIVFIGYYNSYGYNTKENDIFVYLNDKFKGVCKKYKVRFVDIDFLFVENENLFTNRYPSKQGYKVISGEIISLISKRIWKTLIIYHRQWYIHLKRD